jgi:hypothetical protein
MDIERLSRVRAAMAAAPENLIDMAEYGNPACGTAGCIAGWTCAVADKAGAPTPSYVARGWLDLESTPARLLFLDFVTTDELISLQLTKAEVLTAIDSLLDGAEEPEWPERAQDLIAEEREGYGL